MEEGQGEDSGERYYGLRKGVSWISCVGWGSRGRNEGKLTGKYKLEDAEKN